ncbi:hypothetical protein MNB_SV-12-1792 [hydrothermal vent metagenome]|uniref:Uncharacterized protein n=1 Tax=hydrothermal vent metagenome TaxID=652676 RepID=A0A1W1BR43_9ZZZZ
MVEYKGVKWYRYQGALLPRVPPHQEVFLTDKEAKELLKLSRAFFLRYTNEWDREESEFWYIVKDNKEGLEIYKSKVRNQIKKGLKNCIVKKVDRETIANSGYSIYSEAFKNYSTFHKPISENSFKKSILNSTDDFWAVYNKNNILIAYANNFIEENMSHYNSMKFHPKFLNLYPSYALIYTMNEYYLNQKKYLYVNDGARSIAHNTNIQDFLIKKFNFKKSYE